MRQDSEHNASSFLAKQNTAILFWNKTDFLVELKHGSTASGRLHTHIQIFHYALRVCTFAFSNSTELTTALKEPYTEFKALWYLNVKVLTTHSRVGKLSSCNSVYRCCPKLKICTGSNASTSSEPCCRICIFTGPALALLSLSLLII